MGEIDFVRMVNVIFEMYKMKGVLIMKYLIAAVSVLIFIQDGFSQSKKEQIAILSSKIDSLNEIVLSERQRSLALKEDIRRDRFAMDSLTDFIKEQLTVLSTAKTEVEQLKNKQRTLNHDFLVLKQELQTKTDSLNLLLALLSEKSVKAEFPGSCWYGIQKLDTLKLKNNSIAFIHPIDSLDYVKGFEGLKPSFINYKLNRVNKDVFKLDFRNGNSRAYKNDLGPVNGGFYDAYRKYFFKGSLKMIDYYLIEKVNCEWSTYFLVDRETGLEIELSCEPIFSFDNRLMFCVEFSELEGLSFDIYQINSGKVQKLNEEMSFEWSPDQLKFSPDKDILIRKLCMNCSDNRYGKIKVSSLLP